MEASSSQHTCYYRSGYDISFGIYPGVVFPELQAIPPDHRRYFLTFKVSVYEPGRRRRSGGTLVVSRKLEQGWGWTHDISDQGFIVESALYLPSSVVSVVCHDSYTIGPLYLKYFEYGFRQRVQQVVGTARWWHVLCR